LITIFATALLSAITIGILQMNTEEIQLMRNQIRAAEALTTAEAGLNDAFAEIRADSGLSLINPTGIRYIFGPLGNLEGSATQMIVSTEGRSFTITINPATGAVKCVEN